MEKEYNYNSKESYELVDQGDNELLYDKDQYSHPDSSLNANNKETIIEFEEHEALCNNGTSGETRSSGHPKRFSFSSRWSIAILAVQIILILFFYLGPAISLPLITKILYEGVFNKDHIDIFLTSHMLISWIYIATSFVLGVVLGELGRVVKVVGMMFPMFQFDVTIAKRLAPLAVMYLSMIMLNFYFMKVVDMLYYQTVITLIIPLQIGLTRFRESNIPISFLTMLSTIFVTIGFCIGSLGRDPTINFTTNFSTDPVPFVLLPWLIGVLYCLVATSTINYAKKMVHLVNGDWWALLHYLNSMAIVLGFFVLLGSGELAAFAYSHEYSDPLAWLVVFHLGVLFFMYQVGIILFNKYIIPHYTWIASLSYMFQAWLLAYLSMHLFNLYLPYQSLVGFNITVVAGGLVSYFHPHPIYLLTAQSKSQESL